MDYFATPFTLHTYILFDIDFPAGRTDGQTDERSQPTSCLGTEELLRVTILFSRIGFSLSWKLTNTNTFLFFSLLTPKQVPNLGREIGLRFCAFLIKCPGLYQWKTACF